MVLMYLSAVFTWHLMAVAMTTLIIWSIMHCVVNRLCLMTRRGIEASSLLSEYTEDLMMTSKSLTDGDENEKDLILNN